MRLNLKQFCITCIFLCILILTTANINFASSKKPNVPQQEEIKKTLATADSIRVEIISAYCTGSGDVTGTSCGEEVTFVSNLKPDKILLVVKDLKLTKETSNSWGAASTPDVAFTFYKDGKQLTPYLLIGYGNTFANYCYYPFTPKTFNRGIDDATTRRFRQLILHEPLIVKTLKEIGGKDINLDPDYKPKFRPKGDK